MKQHLLLLILIFTCIPFVKSEDHPGDSIRAYHTNNIPVIDGDTADLCWQAAKWQDINYFWITYGVSVPASDFTGRFKVLWNKTTNLLYFVVEITDDAFVNGYVYANNLGTYYNYDVVELFIDEDRSGGTHTNDNNAFAYHITGGNSSVEYDAIDIFGAGTSNKVNYQNHFPEFKRDWDGKHYFWEFSLMVLKNTFTPTAVPTEHNATLTVGKRMGLTVNYCDNDGLTENPKTRDNFISSKYVPQANYNDSYMNASLFGSLILADNNTTDIQPVVIDNSIGIWVDNSKRLNLKMDDSWNLPTIQITDVSGRILAEQKVNTNSKIDVSMLLHGCYLVILKENNHSITQKIIL